ncbi:hypothetical protein D0T84_17505 [Dysgonomonas sp. 521]|uniref:FISUMP domain-containing protein n=1 Tax=Dysgonomonas sp. 521 TaxID=2302932 RepID=UPI0013D11905|nr:FISUMP domain-containing protein [Dysgonomonas sp. 521]NDV96696.1 hypothetical protein [Dysgonomonas sp. 521]
MKTTKVQTMNLHKGRRLLAVITVFLAFSPLIRAQVMVGAVDPPQDFSILEIESNESGGLRLPHLTTEQRDAITTHTGFTGIKAELGRGLTIFNIDTKCVEYWNGLTWIANCENSAKPECIEPCDCDGDGFKSQDCGGDDPDDKDGCDPEITGITTTLTPSSGYVVGEPVTITVGGSGATIKRLSLDGGKTFSLGNTVTVNPAKVGVNSYTIMVNNCPTQTVTVNITAKTCTKITSAKVSSCLPYMFTYQTMNLTATKSGGTAATSYRWYIDGVAVQGATGDTFTLRPRGMELNTDALGNKWKDIKITCEVSNACNMVKSNEYTVTVVYAGDGDGRLYPITVNAVDENGDALPPLTFAHANLGAETDTDPCKNMLGDLYQWGRVADGHQKRTSLTWPLSDEGDNTTIAQDDELDSNGQVKYGNDKYGKFIKNTKNPYDWRSTEQHLWGNNTQEYNPTWTMPDNNPCPRGWKVPSQKQLSAIFIGGKANGVIGTSPNQANTWIKLGPFTTNSASGYKIADALYLPAGGERIGTTDLMNRVGTSGNYWSSSVRTLEGVNSSAFAFSGSGTVYPNGYTYGRVDGYSVRCVKE